jgi:hypothetical protein
LRGQPAHSQHHGRLPWLKPWVVNGAMPSPSAHGKI